MCLAFPGKIVSINKDMAIVDYEAEKRKAKLIDKKLKVGDYVIVQGKIVIEKIPTKDAVKWLEMIKSGKA
jgi:hydrogenase assembly chaperone HypC/HupF